MLKSRKRALKGSSVSRSALKHCKTSSRLEGLAVGDENKRNGSTVLSDGEEHKEGVIVLDDSEISVFDLMKSVLDRKKAQRGESLGEFAIRLHDQLAPEVQKAAMSVARPLQH